MLNNDKFSRFVIVGLTRNPFIHAIYEIAGQARNDGKRHYSTDPKIKNQKTMTKQ